MRRISLTDLTAILNQACFDLETNRFETLDAMLILSKLGLLNEERVDPGPEDSAPEFIEPYQKEKSSSK